MQKLNKVLSLIMTLIIVLSSTITFAENTTVNKFKDIKSTDWYSKTIENLTSKGIIDGYNDYTFRPNKEVTVAEFLKLSMEVSGIKYDNTTSLWHKDLMNKAQELGIITKVIYDSPNEPIKRKDVALILSKLIENTDLKSEFITGKNLDHDRFKYLIYDTTKLSQEYRDSIYKLFEYQLIVGSVNNKDQVFYNPESNLTRAEIATIIERLIEPSKRLNKYAEFPKRSDYFSKYNIPGENIAHNYELGQYFSAHWATPDIKNERFIYMSDEANKITGNYILSEKQIPNLNKIVYDLSRVLIKESEYDFVFNAIWGLHEDPGSTATERVYIQKASSYKSTLTGGNAWSYMFWEKKPANGYDEIGYNNFLWIRVGALWNMAWKHTPTSLTELNGLVEYEYVNMFRASLIAIFGEKDGHEIFEYIFDEYVAERSNIKHGTGTAKYKYKSVGKYKIAYRYGENANLDFYFSFK